MGGIIREVTIGPCRLIQGDCLEVLPLIGKVDAILTDPPYGIKACDRSDGGVGSIVSGSKFYGRESWDHAPADSKLIEMILTLNVPTCIWGGNYFNLPPSSCWLIWDKQQRDFTFADAELAWTNSERAVRCFSYSRGQLTQEGKQHPTQKPIPLMEWCLRQLRLKPQTIVLDCYCGSGSTGVAAINLGYESVLIEREPKYFDIACQRIRRAWQDKCSEIKFDEPEPLRQLLLTDATTEPPQ